CWATARSTSFALELRSGGPAIRLIWGNVARHWLMKFNRMFDSESEDSDAGSSETSSGLDRGTNDEYDDADDFESRGGPEAREEGVGDAENCRECRGANDVASGVPSRQVLANGHQGRLLRYGALSGLMTLVAKLGSVDAKEFAVARDGIANLAEALQRRAYDRLGSQLGLSSLPTMKDPEVSKTKGAPRKGKEPESEPGRQCEVPTKRRRCTSCGVPGHTKRTCTWHWDHREAGTGGGAVPGWVECSSDVGSAPSATMRDKSAGKLQNSEGINADMGEDGHIASPVAEGATPATIHGCRQAPWNPLMGVGGGGPTSFSEGNTLSISLLHRVTQVTKESLMKMLPARCVIRLGTQTRNYSSSGYHRMSL
ncbi:hypothetical protein S245_004153, partial [Arachis hypogaea]